MLVYMYLNDLAVSTLSRLSAESRAFAWMASRRYMYSVCARNIISILQ